MGRFNTQKNNAKHAISTFESSAQILSAAINVMKENVPSLIWLLLT